MKLLYTAAIAACFALLATAGAYAFTVDDSTANNTDGSTKSGFTDPDDKQPDQMGGFHFSAQPVQQGAPSTNMFGQPSGFDQPGFYYGPCGGQPCPRR